MVSVANRDDVAATTAALAPHIDVAATIIDAANDFDVSAIVFTPRGGSRWKRLLSGDAIHKLVGNSDVPILLFPDRGERNVSRDKQRSDRHSIDN